jgi:hypothetical protein
MRIIDAAFEPSVEVRRQSVHRHIQLGYPQQRLHLRADPCGADHGIVGVLAGADVLAQGAYTADHCQDLPRPKTSAEAMIIANRCLP